MTDKMEKYETEYRQQIKTGDLVEFAGPSIINRLIRWRTGHDVNHTAIVTNFHDYYQDRVIIIEALQLTTLNFLSSRLQEETHAYWLPLKPEFEKFRHMIGVNALAFVGTKYDYPGIFKSIFGHVSTDAHRLFCSELAYVALRNTGLPMKNHNRDRAPWPGEFGNLGLFENRIKLF